MLTGLPLFHFFDCGNSYCGEHKGMRYRIEPVKKEEGKELRVILWPEPWCLEKTPESKRRVKSFGYDQAGLDEAIAWLSQAYQAEKETWKAALELPWSEAAAKATENTAPVGEN